jgi:hypothetical protein
MAMEAYSAETADDLTVEFGRANSFNASDLEQNRLGRISRRQWIALYGRALRPAKTTGLVFFGWLLTMLVADVLIPGPVQSMIMAKAGYGVIGVTAGSGLAFLLGLLRSMRLTLLLIGDHIRGGVSHMQGRLSPSWETRSAEGLGKLTGQKDTIYHYVMRSVYFEVSQQAYGVLQDKFEGHLPVMRLYYTPRSRLFVSVEPAGSSAWEMFVATPHAPLQVENKPSAAPPPNNADHATA